MAAQLDKELGHQEDLNPRGSLKGIVSPRVIRSPSIDSLPLRSLEAVISGAAARKHF